MGACVLYGQYMPTKKKLLTLRNRKGFTKDSATYNRPISNTHYGKANTEERYRKSTRDDFIKLNILIIKEMVSGCYSTE